MSNKEPLIEQNLEEEDLKIPVNDKRRFNDKGEMIAEAAENEGKRKEPIRSQREIELENQLKAEIERREAAEAKLVGVQAKFEEAKNTLERETSEMRARMIKTLEDRANESKFSFLASLLPVLDNLNLAVAASEQAGRSVNESSEHNLREGVRGVARSFEQALLSVGVEPILSVGKAFDPELHEAVDMAPVEAEQDGTITKEYSRGYRFGDRLLRPARVQVGKAMMRTAVEES